MLSREEREEFENDIESEEMADKIHKFYSNEVLDKLEKADYDFSKNVEFRTGVENVLNGIRDMLVEKNRKYGNSALNPIRIFSSSSAVEQLNVRIDDKLKRIQNQQEDDDEDAELDLIGYLVLKRLAKRAKAN